MGLSEITYNLPHHFGVCRNVCCVVVYDLNCIEWTIKYRPSVDDAELETRSISVQRLPNARGLRTVDLSLVRQDPAWMENEVNRFRK